MKLDLYLDVDSNFLEQLNNYGVYARSRPTKLYGNASRFMFTVSIPDEAIYGTVEYAPVIEQREVMS